MMELLRHIAGMGAHAERFIVDHGIEYPGRALPKGYRRGPARLCFMNAANLSMRKPGLTYVEGFGTTPVLCGIPAHHAWCIDARGLVVDPTWEEASEASYIGVPVSGALLAAEQLRTKHYGVLFERGIRFNEYFVEKWIKENGRTRAPAQQTAR